ncbi:MAG: 2-oxoacid:acceptor oxidoreductase family protein [Candidatus Krumholzibacteria bacterium]|jgi:2-oxoglutarate ferredoxin oxidoreductase subunit gamma|nr:2-oxoacid:acceptor oxidoreductase family protein [Candidatus Krumholzibacteria bacterium]
MMERYEIRLSGSGGQGLILAGKILAEAAAIYEGRNAVQTQSYGPEARGGASKAEVVISDGEIDYPKALELDLLLSLTQESCRKYSGDLKKGGILIIDSGLVKDLPKGEFKVYSLPITEIATEKVGKAVVTNIVALGILTRIAGVISEESVKKAILARVPKGTEELNMKAFDEGFRAGNELLS